MNKRITKLFSCCLNNEVVVIETNLDLFAEILKRIEPMAYSSKTIAKRFKESNEPYSSWDHNIIEGKILKKYHFQQLV